MLERLGVDVMIVGRGGGSIEDLWAFNEEEVARAIFNCQIPVISAVGHETDTTIADYVADLRAPTPSAAAELAVYDYHRTEEQLKEYELRFSKELWQKLRIGRMRLEKYQTKLGYLHPKNKLREDRLKLADIEDGLRGRMDAVLVSSRHRFQVYAERLNGLSPLKKLSQGYAYAVDEKGKALKSVRQIQKGEHILIHVTDGTVQAKVEEIKEGHHG